jgi:AcrR family transcriptional regulator
MMPARDDTQQRLLQAAVQVFAEKGYEGATVRDICRLAGVNLAAVNYHFRDKERLYIEAVKSACQRQGEANPLPDWPPGTPAVVKLRQFIHIIVCRMLDDHGSPWQRQLFLRELAQPTAACEEVVRERIRPDALVLAGILDELLPDVPEIKRRLTAFSIIGQCVFYRVATPIVKLLVGEEEYRSYDPALLAEHITGFTLNALGLAETKRAAIGNAPLAPHPQPLSPEGRGESDQAS